MPNCRTDSIAYSLQLGTNLHWPPKNRPMLNWYSLIAKTAASFAAPFNLFIISFFKAFVSLFSQFQKTLLNFT